MKYGHHILHIYSPLHNEQFQKEIFFYFCHISSRQQPFSVKKSSTFFHSYNRSYLLFEWKKVIRVKKSNKSEKKLMLIKWDLLFFTVTENYKSSETILIFLDKNSFWKSIRTFFSFRIDNWKMNLLKGNEFMNINRKQTKGLLFVRKCNVSWCMNYVLGRFAY